MFVYYINVPLNGYGMQEMESYDDKMENVKTFELTKEDYDSLRKKSGLFDRFDAELGTVIDVCEEERIVFEQLEKAIFITETYCKKRLNEQERKACNIVLDSLRLSKEVESYWEIDIYLE